MCTFEYAAFSFEIFLIFLVQLKVAKDSDKGTDLDTFLTLRISAALIRTVAR